MEFKYEMKGNGGTELFEDWPGNTWVLGTGKSGTCVPMLEGTANNVPPAQNGLSAMTVTICALEQIAVVGKG